MLDFPSSPTVNQIFTAPNGSTWMWDGHKWASTSAGAAYLPLSGGTMTGDIVLAHDPPAALNPATKQYVDALWALPRYRNRIINGDMAVDQRNGGVKITAASGYVIDRWKWSGQGVGSIGQNASTVSDIAATGYQASLSWGTTTAHTVAAGDTTKFYQAIEGYNFNDANFGTASAQPITLEFWVYSTLTGTFAGMLQNAAVTRSYVFIFSIPTASIWTKIRINIPGDTAGTWNVAGNAAIAYLGFNLGAGSTYAVTAGAWAAGNFSTAPGAVNPVATLNAAIFITGVALMVGSGAANAEPEFKKYSDNLIDCQRYFVKPGIIYQVSGYAPNAGAVTSDHWSAPVVMRGTPVSITSSWSNLSATTGGASSMLADNRTIATNLTATAAGSYYGNLTITSLDADF